MGNHGGVIALAELLEAGRLAARLGVYVQGVENGGLTLRGKRGRPAAEGAQFLHLLGAKQEVAIDPSDRAGTGAHSDEASPPVQDFQPLAVTHRRHGGLARPEFLAQIQGSGGHEAFSDDGLTAARTTTGKYKCGNKIATRRPNMGGLSRKSLAG